MVNRKQMMIFWHVGDFKISHVDEKEFTQMIKWVKGMYGDDMLISRGKKHEYLGMDMYYSVPGEVRVTMVNYLKILSDISWRR